MMDSSNFRSTKTRLFISKRKPPPCEFLQGAIDLGALNLARNMQYFPDLRNWRNKPMMTSNQLTFKTM